MAKLVDRRDARVDKLSGGMRRRLLIARALVHRPRLVLLDEPTVGLDPQVRQELWALIDALRSEGTTILMSTHYIEEAQRLADTVLIMSHGKAVAAGPPSQLVSEHAGSGGARGLRPAARGWPRSRPRPARQGLRTRRTGTSISILGVDERQRDRHRRRAAAREPRGRLRPPHRRGDRLMAARDRSRDAPPRPARALGDHRRARPRGRQLLLLLAVARRSPRRSSRRSTCSRSASASARSSARRRLRLRRVRRHRHGRDGRALLERVPGDVRHVRQVPVPAHVRRDPRCARRHRGARHRGGALDRRRAPASTAACRSSWRSRSGSIPAWGMLAVPVHRLALRASAGRASGSRSPASRSRSRTSTTSSAPC